MNFRLAFWALPFVLGSICTEARAGFFYHCQPKEADSALGTFVVHIDGSEVLSIQNIKGESALPFDFEALDGGKKGFHWYTLGNSSDAEDERDVDHLISLDNRMYQGEEKALSYLHHLRARKLPLKCELQKEIQFDAVTLYSMTKDQFQGEKNFCTASAKESGLCSRIGSFAKTCAKTLFGASCGAGGGFVLGLGTAYLIDQVYLGGSLNSGYGMVVAIGARLLAPIVQGFTLGGAILGGSYAFESEDVPPLMVDISYPVARKGYVTVDFYKRFGRTYLEEFEQDQQELDRFAQFVDWMQSKKLKMEVYRNNRILIRIPAELI